MNNRPKISSLSERELAGLLKEAFFKVGKELKLEKSETKLLLDEVYRKHGWMFIDTFNDAFSSYAACELPEAERMRPAASPMFIGKLMKVFTGKCSKRKHSSKPVHDKPCSLTPEKKYELFIRFTRMYRCLPENPDWLSIYEYLAETGKLSRIPEWETWGYAKKLKYAMNVVSEAMNEK